MRRAVFLCFGIIPLDENVAGPDYCGSSATMARPHAQLLDGFLETNPATIDWPGGEDGDYIIRQEDGAMREGLPQARIPLPH